MVSIKTEDNEEAVRILNDQYKLQSTVQNGTINFTVPHGEEFLPGFVSGFPLRLLSIGLRRPTLEDVFIRLTGHAIREHEVNFVDSLKNMRRIRGH